jgi:hypothetical protein
MSTREEAAFVCSHVFNNTRPVLLVARENGDWMYLCGEAHDSNEKCEVVGRNHLLMRDPTLAETSDLPDEMEAERSGVGLAWERRKLAPE